jgi:threonylcarbamoyladenosine tRNA methylthiotransferase MtaB
MPQVAAPLIRERAKRLREAGEAALRRRLEREVGAARSVLIESARIGRTEHFLPVRIEGHAPGSVVPLTIAGHDGVRLVA